MGPSRSILLRCAVTAAALAAADSANATLIMFPDAVAAGAMCKNQEAALRDLRKISGFEKVSRANLQRWIQPEAEPSVMGRKVNAEFESDVLDNLLFTILRDVDGVKDLEVVANVAHSYAIIAAAARDAQRMERWLADATIQALKFSDRWIVGFLRRNNLRRRRITATEKERPPADLVRARMQAIQHTIDAGGYKPCDIINADETGIFFGAQPKNQYVPNDAARATAPQSNDKARFTAMMWGTADGIMGPPFIIVKNAVTGADQTSSTCLNGSHLMGEEGFRGSDGWVHQQWARTLTLTVKKKPVTALYKRNYIINTHTNVVITANSTAWMDSVTMAMWADVQLGPMAAGTRKQLVMDNCGPHNVPAVHDVLAEHDVAVESLPPHMTSELQVMPVDLVVNGPLKAAIRRQRCKALHSAFTTWKFKWAMELAKPSATRRMQPFAPPSTTLAEGLRALLATCTNDFAEPEFKEGLRRSFISVGLRRDPSHDRPAFRNYTGRGRGATLPAIMDPVDVQDEAGFRVPDFAAASVELEVPPKGDRDVDEQDDAAADIDDAFLSLEE